MQDEGSEVGMPQSPLAEDTMLGTELEAVRKDVDGLISQEGIEALRNELTVSKLTHKQADMLETLSGDVANARQRLSHLESAIAAPLSVKKR